MVEEDREEGKGIEEGRGEEMKGTEEYCKYEIDV